MDYSGKEARESARRWSLLQGLGTLRNAQDATKSHANRKKYETGRSPLHLFAAVAHNSGRLWSEVDRCLSPQLGDTILPGFVRPSPRRQV